MCGESDLASDDGACLGGSDASDSDDDPPEGEPFSDLIGYSRDMWHIGSPDEPLLQDVYRTRNDDMNSQTPSADAACTGAPAGEGFSDLFGYSRDNWHSGSPDGLLQEFYRNRNDDMDDGDIDDPPPIDGRADSYREETLELGESYLGSPSTCNHEMRSPGCNCAPGSDEAGVPKPLVPELPREEERSSVHEGSVVACGRKWKRSYKPFGFSRLCGNLSRESDRTPHFADNGINALGSPTEGATLIEAVVDSGAVDSVANGSTFHGEVKPSKMSKDGKMYRGPDGSRIPNLGQKDVTFTSDEGLKCGLTFQVADVERPLIAASHLTEAGNEVSLRKTGGVVKHIKTGKKINVQRRGGIYVLRMWISPNAAPDEKSSVFRGRGAN